MEADKNNYKEALFYCVLKDPFEFFYYFKGIQILMK